MTSTPIELELVAGRRPRLGQALRELWACRGTILAFAERDIRVKYKQAVMVVWVDVDQRLLRAFHRTQKEEFVSVALRKKLYGSLLVLQEDLDT